MKKFLLAVGLLMSTLCFSQKYTSDTICLVTANNVSYLTGNAELSRDSSVLTITAKSRTIKFDEGRIFRTKVYDNDGCYTTTFYATRVSDNKAVILVYYYTSQNILEAIAVGNATDLVIFKLK